MSETPEGWKTTTLSTVADYINGRAFKPTEWGEEGRPIIRIQNLTKEGTVPNRYVGDVENRHIITAGDLLFSWSATLGAFIYRGEEAVLNQHIFKVLPRSGYSKMFLYYLLNHVVHELRTKVHGTGMQHITKGVLNKQEVVVPPLATQEEIVARIDELLSDVDAGEAILKTAAKAARGCRQSTLNALMLGTLNNPMRGRATEDGKPVLPVNWRWTTLGEVSEMVQYGTGDKAQVEETNVPVLRMGNVRDGRLVTTNLKYMSAGWSDLEKYRLEVGDVLFNRTNSPELVGKAAVFKGELKDAVFASYLIRVRVDPAQAIPEFATYCVNSAFGRAYIASVVSQQVGQANVNGTKLKAFPIPLPPLDEQRRLVSQADELLTQLDALEQGVIATARQATQLRQTILHAAFNGQLI